jgi:hypothetical protein
MILPSAAEVTDLSGGSGFWLADERGPEGPLYPDPDYTNS